MQMARVRFPDDAILLLFSQSTLSFCVSDISCGARIKKVFVTLRWSSGYDARLTRERSPVQSWDGVIFVFLFWVKMFPLDNNTLQ